MGVVGGRSGRGEGYLPFLDGVRAFAVLLVLLYHAGLGFPGGYVGVDAFLVVSGFIVTLGLLREARSGRVSLAGFWARRIRRLLPASFLVVATVLLVGPLVLERQRAARLPADAFASFFSVANVRFFLADVGYLGGLSLPSPLLHFWSLALEEQFYLLFPPLLVLASRAGRRVALGSLAALLAASLAFSALFSASSPDLAYLLLPARAWEFLAGALLAFAWPRLGGVPRGLRSVAGVSGVAVLVAAAASFGAGTAFPGVAAVPVVLGVLGLIFAGDDSVSGRFFALRPLRWVGERSYGIYLWHWPVLVFARASGVLSSPAGRVALLGLSVVLADLSFRVLERPVRLSPFLSNVPSRSFRLGVALCVSAALLVSVAWIAAPSAGQTVASRSFVRPSTPSSSVPAVDGSLVGSPPTSSGSSPGSESVVPASPRVLLVGDSTLAPLRWFVDGSRSLAALSTGVEFVLDAESARRLAVGALECRRRSLGACRGREGRDPSSVVEVLDAVSTGSDRFDAVVVMAGYHSTPEDFPGEVDLLLDAAARAGVRRVFFLTYRESLAFPLEGSGGELSVFGVFNDRLRDRSVDPADPEVVLLDWNGFSASAPDWFRGDGIHVNLAGALGLGEFLARGVASSLGLPCGVEAVCLPPSGPAPAAELLSRYAVVSTDEHCYEMGVSRVRECRPDSLR